MPSGVGCRSGLGPPSANNSTIIIVGTLNMLSGSITIMLIIGSTIISIVGSACGDQQQH
jgi:hypothetical protein